MKSFSFYKCIVLMALVSVFSVSISYAASKSEVIMKEPVTSEYSKNKVEPLKISQLEKAIGRKLKLKEKISFKLLNFFNKVMPSNEELPEKEGKREIMGIISLGLAVLSLFFIPLSLGAVILGILSLVKFKNNPGVYKGKGFAIAGLILGGLIFLIMALFIGFVQAGLITLSTP